MSLLNNAVPANIRSWIILILFGGLLVNPLLPSWDLWAAGRDHLFRTYVRTLLILQLS